jgi:hypothetical protein
MRFKTSLTILAILPSLVLAFLPATSRAQGESGDKKEARIMIRVICSQPVEGATELKLTQGETALHDIAVIPSLLTDPMAVNRGEITLARQSGGADKPVFDHILKVTIPATGSRFVLALFPSAEASPKAPYQHRLIRTDGLRFSASDIYVFNLTKIPVAGGLGKSPFRLDAGASQVVTPVPDGADRTMYQARFFYSNEGKPQIFNDTRWPLAATARIYLFFIPDPARNSMGYVSFREYGPFE